MSLTARHLEAAGIPTVILGSALDVVEHCGVPRFLFTDFPLGNPCGKPFDGSMQKAIAAQGIDLLEHAERPRTTERTPFRWSDDESWRDRYMELRREDLAEKMLILARRGEERRARRLREKADGKTRDD